MKKLPEYTYDENMFFYMNALVDLVNSQQEAIEQLKGANQVEIDYVRKHFGKLDDRIEKLEDQVKLNTHVKINDDGIISLSKPADDTHRTVTLRIPKGRTLVEAMFYADLSLNMSDDQAAQALDEVQPKEEADPTGWEERLEW